MSIFSIENMRICKGSTVVALRRERGRMILCFFVMGKMGCVTKKVAPKTMIYVNIIREMEEKR